MELEFEDDDDLEYLDGDNDRFRRRRPTVATSIAVTSALRTSGFLLVRTHLLPRRLQGRALDAARRYLGPGGVVGHRRGVVVPHPTDPKTYVMFEGIDSLRRVDASAGIDRDGINDDDDDDDDDDCAGGETTIAIDDLEEWYRAARATRTALLRCIAIGLGMAARRGDDGSAGREDDDADYLVRLHDEDNDSMRLLQYSPGDACTGNRCREHSDYGTLTLLLTDGVGGLEAYVDDDDDGGFDGGGIGGGKGSWKPVPYAEGAIVVNVGSILSDWTGGELRATLHRVAGPASAGRRGDDVADRAYRESLLRAVSVPRYSIAYFADPNSDVSIDAELGGGAATRVSDYIRWRSGGSGSDRSGVAFTSTEESRLATIR